MSSGKDDSSEDEGSKKWNGDSSALEDFDKKVARWCRKKYGTEVGNFLWENDVPDIAEMDRAALKTYCEKVWDGINDVNPTAGKTWLPRDSGFWTSEFQIKWVKKQYDRIYQRCSCARSRDFGYEKCEGVEEAPDKALWRMWR